MGPRPSVGLGAFGFVAALGFAIAACSGDGSRNGTFVPTNGTAAQIGPGGGTLEVTGTGTPLDGTRITVPAGAVAVPLTFTIDAPAQAVVARPGTAAMGPSAAFGPTSASFTTPLVLTLRFDPTTLEAGMTADHVFVVLEGSGQVLELIPLTVDLANGVVTVEVNFLGKAAVFKRTGTRQLVVTSPTTPITVPAGATIAPAITIEYRSAAGTLVTGDTFPTLAELSSNPTGATLGGTTSRTPVSGVATFDDLTVSQGGQYTLDFTAPGVTGDSYTFNVVGGGSSNGLMFTMQPPNVAPGGPFTVAVQITDSMGNPLNVSQSVTVSLGANPNSGTLGGTTTVQSSATGLATFSGLTVDRAGVYTLQATSAGGGSAGSAAFTVASPPGAPGAGRAVALTTAGVLLEFERNTPGTIRSQVTLLPPAGEQVIGIDFRPATGVLYAVTQDAGNNGRLYKVNSGTGAMLPVGAAFAGLVGTSFGMAFNPTVDRIRLVSDQDVNLRVNPNDGTLIADTALNPGTPNVVGIGYTNSFPGAATTTLFDVDSGTDQLLSQTPNPNAGTLAVVGGLNVDVGPTLGFDIVGTNTAFMAATVAGATGFYTVNTATGAATLIGAIGPGTMPVVSLALEFQRAYALTATGSLLSFEADAPGTILTAVGLSGLQGGESLVGIDFRPNNGELYGVGSTSRVYRIDTASGVATAVGAVPFTPAISGTRAGIDFNPTVDLLRFVTDADQNLRLNPVTGAVFGTDVNLNPGNPNVTGIAYSNNVPEAQTTTLFYIDSTTDQLFFAAAPNNGTLTLVGALGVDTTDLVGFDIGPNGKAYASLNVGGAFNLYLIDTATGAASIVGAIGSPAAIVDIALALPPTKTAWAVTNGGTVLTRFDPNAGPGLILASTAIVGLIGGDTILGIDFRPATGQLYGLGSGSRLYLITPSTGVATQVGASGAFTLNGVDFGMGFNPTVDRIRVVSDMNQNLRLNPNDGALAGLDTNLDYPAGDPNDPQDPNVVGAGYTNDTLGAVATTLFGIDSNLDILVRQGGVNSGAPSPNTGQLFTIGPLGVDTDGNAGFDIAPDGTAFASLTVGGVSRIYRINLTTGAATLVGALGNGALVARSITIAP